MVIINEHISIPEEELVFTASHSSGPGGQNVNKVSSRVTLWFNVVNSPSLSQEQKELVMRCLGNRIGKDGVMRVISQQTRSQAANRELAVGRFVELMQDALRQVPIRKKTRVSKGAKLRRLENKERQSMLKKERSTKFTIED
jgi:ribosome-associated protein